MTVPQLLAVTAAGSALTSGLLALAVLALVDRRDRAAAVRRHPSGTRVPAPRRAAD